MKDDGASENYVGQKFIDELNCQGAALSAKDVGWMILEMANVNGENGIQKWQRVKSKLWLSASYVYEAQFTVYNVKDFDIVLRKRWMCDINWRY